MNKFIALVVGLMLVGIGVVATSVLFAILLSIGWNEGLVVAFPALHLGQLNYWQAFCLALTISSLRGLLVPVESTVKTK